VDSDGDGIPDKEEGIKDTDGDGIPDFRDVDSDGDGISDDKEYGPTPGKPLDTDGDGIPDYLDIDSDNDGITDRSENGAGPTILDTDGDRIPDYLDLDSDGDGLTDVLEADGTDADRDGRADGASDSKGVPSSARGGLTAPDTDGDGKRDFQDVDSDADGIPDNIEGQGTYVKPAGKDTDKDGIDDAYDKDNGGTPIVPVDTDRDGRPDFRDVDSDGDGIPDAIERGADGNNPLDTDRDGTPDYRDLDSDNDGIPDAIERGPDGTRPLDTDRDGIPDYRDLDSDNDGIPDAVEAGPDPRNPVDTDKDGIPDFRDLDSDNDGIPDADEAGPDPTKPVDSDGDGIPDFREIDSTNDGIPDNETLLIFKTASKPVLATDGSFTYTYTITLRNARKEPLSSVQVKEDLTRTFVSPVTFSVQSVKVSSGLTAAVGFDGRTQVNLLGSGITLAGFGKETIEIAVKVLPNGYSGNVNNTAEGTAVAKWFNVTRQSIDTTVSGGRKHGAGLPTLTVLPMVDIKISDVITPNNDGFNDRWIILRPSNVKVGVTIFNRWGQVVYKTADYKNDWYGTGTNGALGNLLPQGTYYYLVELTGGIFTNKEVRKGYLTIKRDY
jgi:gliding motility-associated-like protein